MQNLTPRQVFFELDRRIKANIKLEILRHYFRLAFDLGIYSSQKYQEFAIRLNEIGKMTGGWIKSLEKR